MKIAIVRTKSDTLDFASYNCQELGLAKALARLGHQTSIFMSGARFTDKVIPFGAMENAPLVEVYRSPALDLPFLQQGVNAQKIAKVGRGGYDLIHMNEIHELETYLLTRKAKSLGVPSVIYQGMYEDPVGRIISAWRRIFNRVATPYIARNTKCVFAKTEWSERYAKRFGFSNTYVLPVGLDPDPLDGGDYRDWRGELGITRGTPIVLYVGKLERRRNTDLMLEIAREFPDGKAVFVFAGEGEDYLRVKLISKTWAKRNIRLLGNVPQCAMKCLYEQASCLLLPSSYEIYGMVILEAMYFGVPVISSRTAGAEQIISHGNDGVIIDGFKLSDWCREISALMEDRSRLLFMRERSIDKVRNSYLWDHVAKEYLKCVRRLVA